ncbi:MAG: dihydrodipicolinate synthase family protein [Pirellulales bacterium]
MSMDLAEVRRTLGSGLLAFPVTHFKPDLSFDESAYRQSIHTNIENGAVGLFAPGGTGEFFSLTLDECRRVTKAAVEETKGRVPIVGGAGYGTAMAVEFAKAAEQAGASAVLVLPQYLVGAEQAGLERHVEAICSAIGIGVIVYNRDNAIFAAETVARLADRHEKFLWASRTGMAMSSSSSVSGRSSATGSSTSAECRLRKSSLFPTMRRGSPPIRPPSTTSCPRQRHRSSRRCTLATGLRRTAC